MPELLDTLLADVSGTFTKEDDPIAGLLAKEAPVGLGEVLRYDHLRKRWLIWNGARWRPDLTNRVYDMLREQVGLWMGSKSFREGDVKAVLPVLNFSKKESVLKSLAAREGIAMSGNEWDLDGYLVGFENGIMDLRTGSWYDKPSSELLVSKSIGIDWEPQAECPTFDWFLNDIMGGDADLVAYMRRMIGYALIGTQAEQKFWMWVGRGSNGKGVLARVLHDAFGDYAEAPADTLYMRSRFGSARSDVARPDLMRLQAMRFTYMSEPPGNQFNEEMLKAHTGEDKIIARDLYGRAGSFAVFEATHKIVFLTNDPPKTDDVGVSMRRRVRVVRFDQDYEENPDRTLYDRLKTEKAGIINLCIREALAWIAEGMPEPKKVADWSAEYIEENDPLAAFIAQRCEVGRRVVGPSNSLWASYEDWAAKQDGFDAMSMTGFGLALSRRFKKVRKGTGMVYQGIRALGVMELA